MTAVSCSVKGVYMALSPGGTVPVVLLAGESDGQVLPIFIGLSEAVSIRSALNREVLPRPFTHDLFIETFGKFDIRVLSLQIDSINDGVYYAQLVLEKDTREVCVDCRPSDGIAIALRADAPISVERAVLDNAGQLAENLPPLVDLEALVK